MHLLLFFSRYLSCLSLFIDQSELEPPLVFLKRGLRRGLPFGLLSVKIEA